MTATNNHRRSTQPGTPTLVEHNHLKFLIINKPSAATLPQFIKDLKKYGSTVLVRCCEPSYKTEALTDEGIKVVDCPFDDGAAPAPEIIKQWLELIVQTFESNADSCIAVHCVAGLGRAPVLVAIALIEYGMKYNAAVEYIRQKRRGAINLKQLQFLEKYRPTNKHRGCCIM